MIPLLVRILHGRTDLPEELQLVANAELVGVAEFVERDSLHQFHDEERLPLDRRPGIEQFGDMRVIHKGDRLPLGLKCARGSCSYSRVPSG
jgi:hypothetical protein